MRLHSSDTFAQLIEHRLQQLRPHGADLASLSGADLVALARQAVDSPDQRADLLEPPALVRLLGSLPSHRERLRHLILEPRQYARPSVIRSLLAQAEHVPSAAPDEAHRLAQLALTAAVLLPEHEAAQRRQLLVRAHLARANGLRLDNRLDSAERSLDAAGQVLLRASLPELTLCHAIHAASLAFYRQRPLQALRHLDRAEACLKRSPDDDQRAKVLSMRAWIFASLDQLSDAIDLLRRARALVSPGGYLEYVVHHMLIATLVDLGSVDEARRLLRRFGHLYRSQDFHPYVLVHRADLLGRYAQAEGDYPRACHHFSAADEQAGDLDNLPYSTLLRIQLSLSELGRGRYGRAATLFRDAYPRALSLQLAPERERQLHELRPALDDERSALLVNRLPPLVLHLTHIPLLFDVDALN